MWPTIFGLLGLSTGFVAGLWVRHAVETRVRDRLQSRVALLQAIQDLENRRVAHDSGRDTLVRAKAGKPARVTDGMATKPGRLEGYLRDSRTRQQEGSGHGTPDALA